MSYNNYGNCGNYGGNYGGNCNYGNQGHREHENEEKEEGIRNILRRIGFGNRIRVHFDSTSHTGRFLGVQNGSVLIIDNNIPIFIPVRKVLAIDLVGQ